MNEQLANASGMAGYFVELEQAGVLSRELISRLTRKNANKEESLEKFKLPRFKSFGIHQTFKGASGAVTDKSGKFFIHCFPKNNNSKLALVRDKNIPWNGVENFVKKLGDKISKYTIEIRESWDPEYSGTIRASGDGNVFVEMIAGTHEDLKKSASTDVISYKFDGRRSSTSGKAATESELMTIRSAITHFCPPTPENLLHLCIFAEFVFRKGKGHRFLEASDEAFWTGQKPAMANVKKDTAE